MRKWTIRISLVVLLLGGVFYWAKKSYEYRYPYGPSHSCDIGMMFALDQFAEENGGKYPAGEDTPEASLSLLYPNYADANTLSGKMVPEEVTRKRLESGLLLTPETCGWHYVEGLTLSDDNEIAILWDKARLGHNGELTPNGSTKVLLVGLGYEYVTADDWDGFLKEQKKLLAAKELPDSSTESPSSAP